MKYRKKPVVIEAVRIGIDNIPDWYMDKVTDRTITLKCDASSNFKTYCIIETLEGTMQSNHGDYLIKGVNGELYPCKPDIFEKTYEKVGE